MGNGRNLRISNWGNGSGIAIRQYASGGQIEERIKKTWLAGETIANWSTISKVRIRMKKLSAMMDCELLFWGFDGDEVMFLDLGLNMRKAWMTSYSHHPPLLATRFSQIRLPIAFRPSWSLTEKESTLSRRVSKAISARNTSQAALSKILVIGRSTVVGERNSSEWWYIKIEVAVLNYNARNNWYMGDCQFRIPAANGTPEST